MAYDPPSRYLIDPGIEFDQVTQQLNTFRDNEWLTEHQLPDEKLLYHYTDLNGLRGILKSRSFWCGHHSTFNDPMEVQHGKKVINELISERKEAEDNPDIEEFYRVANMYVNAFGRRTHHAYLACFCEDGDLLSQWREYSDRGGGYCLGFKFSNQTKVETKTGRIPSDNKIILRKVIYDRQDQDQLVNTLLDMALIGLKNTFEHQPEGRHNRIASLVGGKVSNLLIDLLISFKDDAFEQEKEWRLALVFLDNHEAEDIKFKDTKRSIIPYRECFVYDSNGDNLTLPISKVRYGPSLEQKQIQSTLPLFLHHMATTDHESGIKIPKLTNVDGTDFKLRV